MFLTTEQALAVRETYGTPCYVYDRAGLEDAADRALAFPAPYGFTLRYAMKANPNRAILEIFRRRGLHIDASSDFEVERAIRAGFLPSHVQLTSQYPSRSLKEHVERGVLVNACSLHQLQRFGEVAPGQSLSVRINPGLGSGSTKRTNTGGPGASFGIWHEYLDEVQRIAERHRLRIDRLHTHIGSGTDPEVWKRATRLTLEIAAKLPDVESVNLGGGFKVGRMPDEPSTDLQDVGGHVQRALEQFAATSSRRLHLEIEPGTALVANAGLVLATCVDVVDTGAEGYRFAKLDAGMPEVTRPSLYGAQHPIAVLGAEGRERADVVFVGPCCESGDVLTPAPGDPEALGPRPVPRPEIGDLIAIGGTGAYCAAMATVNYNSYPQAPEVMLERDGTTRLIRRRQTFSQMIANEVV